MKGWFFKMFNGFPSFNIYLWTLSKFCIRNDDIKSFKGGGLISLTFSRIDKIQSWYGFFNTTKYEKFVNYLRFSMLKKILSWAWKSNRTKWNLHEMLGDKSFQDCNWRCLSSQLWCLSFIARQKKKKKKELWSIVLQARLKCFLHNFNFRYLNIFLKFNCS